VDASAERNIRMKMTENRESQTGSIPSNGNPLVRTKVSAISLLALAAIVSLPACGGGGGAGGTADVKSISITPTGITVPLNTQADFTATVTLTDSSISTTTTLTWEVNGIAGGSSTVGTIQASPTDELVGIYTAPANVPTTSSGQGTQVGQVIITAVAQQSTTSSSSSTGTITSNNAIVTVGSGQGIALTPISPTVPAGGNEQFAATLNSLPTTATWSVSSTNGGNIGSIDQTGLYTAPLYPPPGAIVTVTASVTPPGSSTVTATSTVTIVYSDATLSGPYAFSFTGNDSAGFLAVAGSFAADGNGHITGGVEDIDSFRTGVSTEVPISNTSTYTVGPDGRGLAKITAGGVQSTWYFALTTNQHAELIRGDTEATGGGTIDQQSLGAISNSTTVISGPYVFSVLGLDAAFNPLAMAGEFHADSAGGIPETNSILDVNDNGISSGKVTTSDTTLHGCYQFDPVFPGTGRGTITLESTTIGQGSPCASGVGRTFAFYAVTSPANSSQVIQLHLVEIDGTARVAGDMFGAAAAPGLASGTYVFTAGGNTSVTPSGGGAAVIGAYAAGGVFVPNGSGTITSGTLDANSEGTYNSGPALGSCSYSAPDPATGRIDLKLFVGTGTCASTNIAEFAVYQTVQGAALMLELDSSVVSTGTAYTQCVQGAPACSTSLSLLGGSFALGLTGQGVFHGTANSALFQPDIEGEVPISLTTLTGNLDINNFSEVFPTDPISATGTSIGTPTTGRGTATVAVSNPAATYKLIYYLIDDNTALLFSSGSTLVATGSFLRQF